MKNSTVRILKLLLPFIWLLAVVLFVSYKLITEYNELESWKIICLSVGGTLILSMLLAFVGLNIFFKKKGTS
ncbi:hypothetical protein AWW68_06125 [Roseivirga spongicola]|uniref:Uncharacterized protein n=1 Tax=Roseivirga spongicola TaxID=333140 RepID=A0A150XHZ1_9BACT|nr:hypothetical protein AWW68_06125 [Roseivirga spongicola]|tara:strand:- start:426 stop:641 length:216 start_codon:yes stop_codon:yes gene_type:complete